MSVSQHNKLFLYTCNFILVYNKNTCETVAMVTEESMSQSVKEANEKSNNHEVGIYNLQTYVMQYSQVCGHLDYIPSRTLYVTNT